MTAHVGKEGLHGSFWKRSWKSGLGATLPDFPVLGNMLGGAVVRGCRFESSDLSNTSPTAVLIPWPADAAEYPQGGGAVPGPSWPRWCQPGLWEGGGTHIVIGLMGWPAGLHPAERGAELPC